MQDLPRPDQLLAAVAGFLRQEAGPALGRGGEAALAYHAKVAANMLDIVARQLSLAPAAEADELARLRTLFAAPEADLAALNQRLADALAEGIRDPQAEPALADHLWRTTLAKLAVDQPRYATYRQVIGEPAPPAR